ncbi:MAG TPA: carbon-nitrogen hydrolase family protein [Acidimicrobiales bacterium]|nr:carbon-nitrogen hydrolase family protein [Acidimicrobiales bacterium]
MRVAAAQTTAGPDRGENLAAAAELVAEAAGRGARLVVLPELFSVAGSPARLRSEAEPLEGPTLRWAADVARRHGIFVVAGSFPERAGPSEKAGAGTGPTGPSARPRRRTGRTVRDGRGEGPVLYNTSCLVDSAGSVRAVYRKLHLFDARIGETAICESATFVGGRDLVVASLDEAAPGSGARAEHGDGAERTDLPPSVVGTHAGSAGASPSVRVGFSICYDLRFPELYRSLALRGATLVVVPSAFTAATGPAHWEVLLRARAIENAIFVVAAGQVGRLPAGMPACHGHSMIVDPWGTVLDELREDGPGVAVADVSLERVGRVRAELPVLAHRRPDAYL